MLNFSRLARSFALVVLLVVLLVASGCARQAVPSKSAAPIAEPIERTLLERCDLPEMPGWELRLYLIEYAPGAAAPRHHHPVAGLGYVVRGSFESAFEKGRPVIVHEGQSFQDLRAIPHVLFRNVEASRPLEFVIAYVVPRGAPVVSIP